MKTAEQKYMDSLIADLENARHRVGELEAEKRHIEKRKRRPASKAGKGS